jgi:hypothetical protein
MNPPPAQKMLYNRHLLCKAARLGAKHSLHPDRSAQRWRGALRSHRPMSVLASANRIELGAGGLAEISKSEASGSERDRAVNSTGVLTRETESFSAKSWAPRRTFKVSYRPREISPKTERCGWSTTLTQILCIKAANAKRREAVLSAFPVNSRAAFVRRSSVSSPRGTLFVTTSLFAKAVSRCADESCQFRVPLGGFQIETGSNTVVRLLTHRRVLPTGRASGRRGCRRHARTSPDRRAGGQSRSAVTYFASSYWAN